MSMFTDLSQASSSILASYVTTGLGILHLYLAYKNYWRQTETPTDLDGSEKQSTVRFTPQENSNSNTKAQESHTVGSRSTKVNGDMSNTIGNPTSPSRPPSIPLVGPTSPAKTATRTSSLLAQPISEGTELQLTPEKISDGRFDIQAVYNKLLENQDLPMPVAAILALTELISNSKAATMYELVEALKDGASDLKKKTPNPISLTAGCDLFIRYVTTARQDFDDFFAHKTELVRQGRDYAAGHAAKCREIIADHAFGFIQDDAVILTHSYSRVVMQALLRANKRKRISVYVTEARPRGLGMKTYEALTAAGIPCTVVLDSAVAYVMDQVDMVLVGTEAVVESGGLINAVGTLSMAIIAQAAKKPFYALAESYKFLRLFPLSQYDLPTHNPSILALPSQRPTPTRHTYPANKQSSMDNTVSPPRTVPPTPRAPATPLRQTSYNFTGSGTGDTDYGLSMSEEQILKNPDVDYTRPDLITLVFSDVGILTPEGISSFLVGVFAD